MIRAQEFRAAPDFAESGGSLHTRSDQASSHPAESDPVGPEQP